jgi:hypothetical protein
MEARDTSGGSTAERALADRIDSGALNSENQPRREYGQQ